MDVRMRGFRDRSTVEAALCWVDEFPLSIRSELVSLAQLAGRVLADDVISTIDVPSFDRSAMDGYALVADETNGASSYAPLSFTVIGESLAGRPCHQPVGRGEAIRIMTGAPLPAGADSVVPVEFTQVVGNKVEITAGVSPGKNVGRRGEDIKAASRVLRAGRRLRPQDVAVIASLGQQQVSVAAAPRVRVIITGNELIDPGQPRQPHQIFEANSYLLRPLIERDGGTVSEILKIPDQSQLLEQAISTPGADLILISGGSSVGAEDHAPLLLQKLGTLAIHGIAMRPSSPAGMGSIGSIPLFLLPGNPVSCLCAYDFFAGRLIRRLAGRNPDWPYPQLLYPVARKIVSAIGRVDYCRVRRTARGIEPLAISGASILSSTSRADGFLIIPAEREGYGPGEEVNVYLYDHDHSGPKMFDEELVNTHNSP